MTDFHALYESYAPHVRRFSLFLCGDQALADDITSETFVRAWTASGGIRQETVKAYLFTIARNLYHDHLRDARRHTVLDNTLPDGGASAPKQVEARLELEFVLAMMQKLPEVDRAALLMRAQEGLPHEEISRALGLSVAAVKVKIHRARVKLMKATATRNERNRKPEEDI